MIGHGGIGLAVPYLRVQTYGIPCEKPSLTVLDDVYNAVKNKSLRECRRNGSFIFVFWQKMAVGMEFDHRQKH